MPRCDRPAVNPTFPRVRIVGDGRTGGSFARALESVGWNPDVVHHDYTDPTHRVDLVLCCVPDSEIGSLVADWTPRASTVVAHCAGALGLDSLAPHPRVGTLHPLVSLPDPERGARRLLGAWFGISGDPLIEVVVEALGGSAVTVPDEARSAYHAAAVMASNHLVALMGQVERSAAVVGVPLGAYLDLAQGSLDNVREVGPTRSLTGPVSRGDWATVSAHLAALDPDEVRAYLALAEQAARLVGRDLPTDLVGSGS